MNQPSCSGSRLPLPAILRGGPQAAARITGSESCPGLSGAVRFCQTKEGVIVLAEIIGLPHDDLPFLFPFTTVSLSAGPGMGPSSLI